MQSPIIFVIPSRDEQADLLYRTVSGLRRAAPQSTVILVDDCSGPAAAADAREFASATLGLHLVRTDPPGGAGRAMAAGLAAALKEASDDAWICTVEADASVPPADLLAGLARAGGADVCFFHRRWGTQTHDYPAGRIGLSRGASWLHRRVLGRGPADWTLFYRGYRASFLRGGVDALERGPADFSWQAWGVYRLLARGAAWVDAPVRFDYRRHGRLLWRRHVRHIVSHLRLAGAERLSLRAMR